jgi:pimeloyl-ACP methyl ester carboxylesterase
VARYPIVLIHGWTGAGTSFNSMIPKLQAQGFTVLDMNSSTAGTQALTYNPTTGQHIPALAKQVQDKIQAALAANGYPATQPVDIVAHSMGGLVARFLIEHPGADVDSFDSTGWHGDGVADIRTDWASRVDDLVMLGTPNHGTWEGWVPGTIGGFGAWNASGGDMKPGSTFLTKMGYAEPAGETYTAIGGDPTYGQFLKYDYTGDGVKHGFDGVVPAESPFVTGANFDLVGSNHGELLTQPAPRPVVAPRTSPVRRPSASSTPASPATTTPSPPMRTALRCGWTRTAATTATSS